MYVHTRDRYGRPAMSEEEFRGQLIKHPESILTTRTCGKSRMCDGYLVAPHRINVGDPIVWSALPPGSDIGNTTWWRHAFCDNCAPIEATQ